MTEKEKKSAYDKEYYKRNKESMKENGRRRRAEKPEVIKETLRLYHIENKEHLNKYSSDRCEAHKIPFTIIYCLPNENPPYVGKTMNPTYRMLQHKSMERDPSDWFILDICNTDKEAVAVERSYHNKGYSGKRNYKL